MSAEISNRDSRLSPRQIRLMRLASYASMVVALALVVLKAWAWAATDSVALLSSLADSILDLLASAVTFFAVKVAVSPADSEHRFGHGKSEGISSLIQAVIVTGSAAYVGAEAVSRLLVPGPISQPAVGMGVMLVSLLLTSALIVFQRFVVRQTGSLAISADSVHYRADLLTNIGVLAAIFISARWNLYVVDPLLGLVIAGLILISVWEIVRQALDVLLDRELPDGDRARIQVIGRSHPEVRGLHDLRTRSSGSTQFIQFHLELDPAMPLTKAHEICDAVELQIRQAFPTAEVLIHADPFGLPEDRDPF